VVLYTWPLATGLGTLWPDNHDPRLFTWVLLSVFRNLVTQPAALFQGNAFYPIGSSLTFAEPLLLPALVAGPLHAVTGAPILAHNATLLVFWALSGWAMYWLAHHLTGSHPAAAVAALVFTVCPYRTEQYLAFQMEMAFGIPLAVHAFIRFLETQRPRHLAAFCLAFWLQAVTVWYYALLVAIGLAAIAPQYAALRWRGWRPRALAGAAAAAGLLALALVPVAWPLFVTRRELGFERGLADVVERSAEVLTYLELRPNWLYDATPGGYYFETSLFPGAVALVLAAVGVLWLRRPAPAGRLERGLATATVAGLLLAVLALATRGRAWPFRAGVTFSVIGLALFGLLLAREAVEGWARRPAGDRRLGPRGWVLVLLGLALVAFLLSLGPEVRLAGQPMGRGIYAWLYDWLLPLRGIRAVTRIGLLVVFAVGLLAALGVAWLQARLPRPVFAPVFAALGLLLGLEYATTPLEYARAAPAARPVDRVLARVDPGAVVLEWPTYVPASDADAMFRSIAHGHRIVNGYSGFVPALLRDLSGLLTDPGPPFPTEAARAALARIYPLRYLVVRGDDPELTEASRQAWLTLREAPPPWLAHRGTHGADDLYEVLPGPETGRTVERWVSYDFLRRRPRLRVGAAPARSGDGLEQWVDVLLNGRRVQRVSLPGPVTVTARLERPLRRAAANVIALRHGYRRPPAARDMRYRIGATGVLAPGDLAVRSAGQPWGNQASIALNDVELAPNRRGYNLVALAPDGGVRAVVTFDTFADPAAAAALAEWVAAIPEGTVVAGAVRDEASGRLDETAVVALRTLGVAGDLRGGFRESHAFVGVKGAPPGGALEARGPRAVELVVGRPEPDLGVTLTAFELADD
jgi:hypothetical protein